MAISSASIGIFVTVTQIGYVLGLIFIVPLGDLLHRRRLVVGQTVLSALALIVVGFAPTAAVVLVGMAAVGLLAVAVQVIVAFAATIAAPAERGRVVGGHERRRGRYPGGPVCLRVPGGPKRLALGLPHVVRSDAGDGRSAIPYATPPGEGRGGASYPDLIRSMIKLFREEPILRARAGLALLIFATFNVLWAPLVLPLGAPPYSLSP